MKTIETERLVMSQVKEIDIDIYRKILSSIHLTKFLPKGKAYTETEIQCTHRNRIAHWVHGFGSYVINLKSHPDKKIGYVGVELCEDPNFSDIRYGMLQEYQCKGYVLEASVAVIRETFGLNKHKRIYGVSMIENLPSVSVLRKLGMTPEPNLNIYQDCDELITFSIDQKTAYDLQN
ncbi:GNAT family N-acetyltransferase [Vibrio pectenicida]|uniref:N-acetyltransferase n=1 Tax=Vibrio pectenicida TaxID=62763 RepID=A0A427U4X2_9VIBR|nr:GNAT family protein [Vibrio pectenicida]RSD31684.1 N-acetyltransferase [Vibrio pectenicida]